MELIGPIALALAILAQENEGRGKLLSVYDYYRSAGVRDLQHAFKSGATWAVQRMCIDLAPFVPEDAVLIPMPGRSGRAVQTRALVECLSRETGRPWVDALRGNSRPSMYDAKKSGNTVPSFSLWRVAELPPGYPVIVDNVVDSGSTARAALRAIPGAMILSHASVRR